jgi:hypothetical protein
VSDGQTIHVKGVADLVAKLDPGKLAGEPGRNFLNRWALAVERGGKDKAPKWRGHLRRSITHEIEGSAIPRYARVGTNVAYAEAMEFGTGLLSESPNSKHTRHYPPPAALDAWAIAHGFHAGTKKSAKANAADSPGTYGKQVSDIIGRRGDLKPRRYLRDAADETKPKIPGWIELMAQEIEQGAASGA